MIERILMGLTLLGIVGMFVSGIALALAEPTVESRSTTPTQDNVYIFISFSMPKESLQQWAAQAQKIHAPLIIQGLVEDSFAKTQHAVADLAKEGEGGVVLDPRLFRQYHITQVPAVVVVHPTISTPCLRNQSCWHPETDDVVLGDVGLESALQTVVDRGDNTEVAQRFLAEERRS